jgi:hypothetical protein
MNEDADSIFGEKPKHKPVVSGATTEQLTEPLIIQDSSQKRDDSAAAVADMPSVSHLPDPKDGKAPGPV